MTEHHYVEWTDERVAKFWDYESQYPKNYFTYQFGDVIVKRLEKYFRGKRRILDYGCGTGFIMPHLFKFGAEVTGIDFSKKSVEVVNKTFHKVSNFKGAFLVEEALIAGTQFDAIVVIEVIEHLTDLYLEATLRNVRQLLSKDGIVVFTTPHDEDLSALYIRCPACESIFHRWQHVRSWTKETLVQCVQRNGLQAMETYPTDFSLYFSKNRLNYLAHMFEMIRGAKPKMPHLVCVCKKQA